MTRLVVRAHWIAILVAVAGAAIFFYARSLHAADDKFPIYFEDSILTVKADSINRTIYLPLIDLVDHLHLAYTNATVLETFAIGGPNTGIVLAKNSRIILVNGQQTLLGNPVLHENQQWKVPIDFLSQGLTRITGIEFRYKPGTLRMFAG